MPRITGLLESALYVADKPRAVAFFRDVMGLEIMLEDERLTAFNAGGSGVLLIFAAGESRDDLPTPGGAIPGHDGAGPVHMAFAIPASEYEEWRDHLRAHGARDRGEVLWPAGGRSFYFEDPDGHVLEVATPGLWPNY